MTDNAKSWDESVEKGTDWCHFLQSAEWAEAMQTTAWTSQLTEVKIGNTNYPLALYQRPAAGIGKIYLTSKLATLSAGQCQDFTANLRQMASSGVAIKMDIDQVYDDTVHQALLRQGWLRSPSIQYQETVLVDLTKTTDELLASFKKRARWEINAGQRRGIKVEKVPVTPENINLIYGLLKQTYTRANFFTRSQHFTETYWRAFDRTGQGAMYVASLEDKPLAAAYIINIGQRAYYKDGASVRIKPDVFASRVMQWHIMQDLKEQGVKTYDLCGISSNPKSPLAGVTLFKTGFAEPISLQWGYELPLSKWRYQLWKNFLERSALKYSSTVRRELWY